MTTTKLHDTGTMSVGGNRGRVIVSKTAKGITVKYDSLYSGERACTEYYRDGNYPQLPENWEMVINEYMTTEAEAWLHNLGGYTPDRVTR